MKKTGKKELKDTVVVSASAAVGDVVANEMFNQVLESDVLFEEPIPVMYGGPVDIVEVDGPINDDLEDVVFIDDINTVYGPPTDMIATDDMYECDGLNI